ncbi:asparaginyl-tRNA synthetase [Friedmanniomyces endolithicus]|uniref:asparagine--tRNA ligase n=1 Tax=Rachicladosporium monterosium TaxID=1507873 RepID=A0ABR0LFD0_9PEZI|nr:asparaginyl-tRNA synthetase [Friedmanniomyces endolithicus]KAK1094247.1 asparaginyl-tRNA synthetase [Friedmanniomyces endolithicus]KAK5147969.1 asparaginyl-tRNA synthetase [Rachicladosporium monterosium]
MRACLRRRCNFRSHNFTRPFSISPATHERVHVARLLSQQTEVDGVDVYGWVRSLRRQKKVAFVAVGDGSTLESVQAVLKPEDAAQLSTGAAVRLTGSWQASKGSKQSHELQVTQVAILGANDAEHNPLQPKYQTPEYLRTIPHLRPRIPANALLLRLRSQVIASLTHFFNQQGFVQTHTPIITSSDCEGAGEVFTVSSNTAKEPEQRPKPKHEAQVEHFFRTPKYLTVSAQLHLEALAQAVDKVWTLSPTFRAERSDTPRHLSEFYMLEAELCFTDDLSDVMAVVEGMLVAIASDLLRSNISTELLKAREASQSEHSDATDSLTATDLKARWTGLASGAWPRITYAHAITLLQTAAAESKATFTFQPSYETGLQAEHERWIAATVGEGKCPVFVTDYPAVQKPFYMSPSSASESSGVDEQDTAACFDLLVPELCELAGGSLREHRGDELRKAMEAKGAAGGGLEWYQDLRKYGSVPHGGFGLGFDRLICYLSGVGNVRDVVAFPRWVGRCEC